MFLILAKVNICIVLYKEIEQKLHEILGNPGHLLEHTLMLWHLGLSFSH